jgi:uncharacterized protein (DUF1501 family)
MSISNKFITRRDFVKQLAMSTAGAAILKSMQPTVAFAQSSPPLSGPIDIYIRVYLSGGVDGLTLIPPKDPSLHAALKTVRPILMGPANPLLTMPNAFNGSGMIETPAQVLDIGRTWGMHPLLSASSNPTMVQNQLAGIYQLLGVGQAKVLSKIGFPEMTGLTGAASGPLHDLNHVTATDPWNIGKTQIDRGSDLFWEVRLMQQAQLEWNQFWALGTGGRSVPIRPFPGGPVPTVANRLSEIKKFQIADWDVRGNGQSLGGEPEINAAQQTIQEILNLADAPDVPVAKREFKRGMRAALDNSAFIQNNIASIQLPSYFPSWEYPHGTGDIFRDVARIIQYYHFEPSRRRKLFLFVGLPNFDTHANQDAMLPFYIMGINHCIGALQKFLAANGAWNKTVIQFVSEFGRGISTRFGSGQGSNATFLTGTPHGWGSMHLLLGGSLNASLGSVIGDLPTLSDITNPIPIGDPMNPESTLLRATLDPRSIFYRVIEGMGFNPSSIFPGFTPAGVGAIAT